MTISEQTQLRPWQQSAIGDRRSVVGAIVIAVVVVLYVVAIPLLDDNLVASLETDESGRFIVDDYTTVLIPDGWLVESQNELLTTLTNGTYQFVIVASSESDEVTAQSVLQPLYDGFAADPANELTGIESFTTDSGGDGAGYRAVLAADESGNGSASFAVLQNGRAFQPLFTGPAELDDPFYEDAEAIVRTVEIREEPRSGS